jgi:hypothetical protein
MVRGALLMDSAILDQRPAPARGRLRAVLAGAFVGLATGIVARIWIRTLVEGETVFTIGGTGVILVAFTGFGACAGLAYAWRRYGSRRRLMVQRGVGMVPLLFMGPFVPFFLPSVFGSWLAAFPGWPRWSRRALWAAIASLGGFFLLVCVGRGPVGVASFALWAALSHAMFLSQRIVFEPRGLEQRPAATPDQYEPWVTLWGRCQLRG